jgi:preprotein translocase subunit SecE
MNRQLRRHPVGGTQPGQTPKTSARLPKLAPQAPRPNRGIKGLLKPYWATDIASELKKVSWPSRQEAWNLTVVVIVISLMVGVLLGGIDLFFSWLVKQILF